MPHCIAKRGIMKQFDKVTIEVHQKLHSSTTTLPLMVTALLSQPTALYPNNPTLQHIYTPRPVHPYTCTRQKHYIPAPHHNDHRPHHTNNSRTQQPQDLTTLGPYNCRIQHPIPLHPQTPGSLYPILKTSKLFKPRTINPQTSRTLRPSIPSPMDTCHP
jgi:hypothetical protein